MSSIKASLVASGVGLPPTSLVAHTIIWISDDWAPHPAWEDDIPLMPTLLDLADPQTAFGLAMRLDEWEGRPAHTSGWLVRVAHALPGSPQWTEVAAEMIARIEHIGRDHGVRRAMGYVAELGTLGVLTRDGDWWCFTCPRGGIGPEVSAEWELPNITDPAEALKAIHAAVCGE